jgi:hypothetical protein
VFEINWNTAGNQALFRSLKYINLERFMSVRRMREEKISMENAKKSLEFLKYGQD